MRKIPGLIGALVLVLTAVSCGGGGDGGVTPPPPPPPPATCPANTFCMGGASFSPTARTVAAGTTVTWKNDSGTAHNVTWNDAAGRNAALAGDGTGDITPEFEGNRTRLFNAAGTYPFHCTIHAGMNATLTVQ